MCKDVLAAGNWIAEWGKRADRWSGEGNLSSIFSGERAPGGGPANVLFDLAVMDPDDPLLAGSRIGEDADGDSLLAETGRRGIDGLPLWRTPGAPASYADVRSGPSVRTFFSAAGANTLLSAAGVLYAFARRLPLDAALPIGFGFKLLQSNVADRLGRSRFVFPHRRTFEKLRIRFIVKRCRNVTCQGLEPYAEHAFPERNLGSHLRGGNPDQFRRRIHHSQPRSAAATAGG